MCVVKIQHKQVDTAASFLTGLTVYWGVKTVHKQLLHNMEVLGAGKLGG